MAADPYLMIETSGPWRGPGCARFIGDAVSLVRAGHEVRLVLLQDGVSAAVPQAVPELGELVTAGAVLWADGFSLAQRGLVADRLLPAVRVVSMDEIAKRVLDPSTRVVWH